MFVVLIFLIAASSVFSYHLAEDRYNQLVNERGQSDWERYNERLVIPSAVRDGTGTAATLNASIQNVGAVSAHLVTLFLSAYDSSNSPRLQLQYAISMWIGSGTTKYNFGQDKYGPRAYNLTSPGVVQPLSIVALPSDSLTYVIKIVTERGNIVTYKVTGLEGGGLSQLSISPGTMEINHLTGPPGGPYVITGWKRSHILFSDLTASVDAHQLKIRAKFANNGEKAISIAAGTVQFPGGFSSSSSKAKTFSGSLYLPQPVIIYPGQSTLLEFLIDTDTGTWPSNAAELAKVFVSNNQLVLVGYAGFTSSKGDSDAVFFSSALLIDGILVHRYA
jgi:hypothetical protein